MTDDYEDDTLEMAEEFEEITSEEVDRVVESLETLAESVTSENIRTYLEDVTNTIYELVYDETDEVEDEEAVDDDDVEMLDDEITDEAA